MGAVNRGHHLMMAVGLICSGIETFSQAERDTSVSRMSVRTVEQAEERKIFTVVEQMPVFPGGENEMYRFLGKSIRYPIEAKDVGASGVVYVTFLVEKDGSLTDVKVLRGVHPSLDAEAVRVVSMMPAWEPGRHQGEVCCVQFNLPIRFTLRSEATTVTEQTVEEEPSFPGGVEEMYRFISKNLRYPEGAELKGIDGTVYITFEVDTTGALKDIKVLRGIHPAFDAEAVRVVESMPAWRPGRRNGKAVRVQFNLPVKFRMRK